MNPRAPAATGIIKGDFFREKRLEERSSVPSPPTVTTMSASRPLQNMGRAASLAEGSKEKDFNPSGATPMVDCKTLGVSEAILWDQRFSAHVIET